MRNRMLNNSKEATSHEKKRVADVGKFLLAADVEVTTPNFADMPLSSDISTPDTKASSVADFVTKQADASDLQAEGMEIRRFKINRARDDTLSFKRNAGDARRGNPTRPVLSRALAVERCALVRDAIIEDSTVDTFIYEDGIDGNTISDAGHQGLLATKIEWSMKELEDLYEFAHMQREIPTCATWSLTEFTRSYITPSIA
ncbi:unnamed protein product [Alternaria alternata]